MKVMKPLLALLFIAAGALVYTSMSLQGDSGPRMFVLDGEAEEMAKSNKFALFVKKAGKFKKKQSSRQISSIKFITVHK